MEETFKNEGELPLPSESDASPTLYNLRLAAYEWGGGEIIFYPVAGFNKKGFLTKNLFALHQGVITDGNTQDDLVCLLAFLHEYRHYQQDMLTGVGHWDYVARTRQIVNVISLAKQASKDGTAHEPLSSGLSNYVQQQSACLLQRPEAQEIALIEETLAPSESNADQLAPLLTTRRLLEADAVLHVYMLVVQSRADDATATALCALERFYEFFKMPAPYSDTLLLALSSFNARVLEEVPNANRIKNFLRTTRLMLTMCLAHPDPDTLKRLGHDAQDYLPGVRYIRLLQAGIKQMLAPGENLRTICELEADLLAKAGFPYPSYFDCETGWTRYFNKMQDDPFPAVTAARSEALSRKYPPGEGAEWALRRLYADKPRDSVLSFIAYDLPLLMRRTDHATQDVLLTGRGFLVPEYNSDRLRHILAWRLTEFMSRRQSTFSCPLFVSANCEAKTERCLQPYADLNDVPASDACRVREICFHKSRTTLQL